MVGEEGVSVQDYAAALAADFLDSCLLQQNAFDAVDGATPADRQRTLFDRALQVIGLDYDFESKDAARETMLRAADLFRTWNYTAPESAGYRQAEERIAHFIERKGRRPEAQLEVS